MIGLLIYLLLNRHVSPCGIDFMRRLLVKDPNFRYRIKIFISSYFCFHCPYFIFVVILSFRMSSEEALNHPFITGLPPHQDLRLVMYQSIRSQITETTRIDILRSLRTFASFDLFTKIVIELVSYSLTVEQVSTFLSFFFLFLCVYLFYLLSVSLCLLSLFLLLNPATFVLHL